MPGWLPLSRLLALGGLVLLSGCDQGAPAPESPPSPPRQAESRYDPAHTGTIHGQVTWVGALPVVPGYRSPENPLAEGGTGVWKEWAHPHDPAIDPTSRGVGGALVFLQKVDPEACPPWPHAAVRVEVQNQQLQVVQGKAAGRVGFVRRGEQVEVVSRQSRFATLQFRGATFFSLPLPEPGKVHTRTLSTPGVVELTSGSGQFWMRGYLFVADHPYFARCDSQGRFSLEGVPAGDHELVCWLPDWRETSRELDADTGLVWKVTYRPALQRVRQVTVTAGKNHEVHFPLTAE